MLKYMKKGLMKLIRIIVFNLKIIKMKREIMKKIKVMKLEIIKQERC